MRRGKKQQSEKSFLGVCVFASLALLAFLLCRRLAAIQRDALETSVPDDSFAVSVSASADGESRKIVCLTFDDGPSPNTDEILSILNDYQVPTTFFVTAQDVNQKYLSKVSDIAVAGHQVALHSASHEYRKIYASTSAFWLDIKELRQALSPYVDSDSLTWIRFPGGSTNTVSHKYGGSDIMKKLISQTEEKGLHWIDWNVCGEDATRSHPNAEKILENIQKDSEGKSVCVVLLHDTKATGQTVLALPSIIEWYQSNGYTFCRVDEIES